METTNKKTVEISKRDLVINYEVDKKPLAKLAESYNISFEEMKRVLWAYDITVRKNEEKPQPKAPEYDIYLVDLKKNLSEIPKVERKAKVVSTDSLIG